MRNDYDKLGSIIKATRLNQKLTREQLSEKISISPRYLLSIENEKKKPSFEVLFNIIRALNISADLIFYPDAEIHNIDKEQLIGLINSCDDYEIKVALATVHAMREAKKTRK